MPLTLYRLRPVDLLCFIRLTIKVIFGYTREFGLARPGSLGPGRGAGEVCTRPW